MTAGLRATVLLVRALPEWAAEGRHRLTLRVAALPRELHTALDSSHGSLLPRELRLLVRLHRHAGTLRARTLACQGLKECKYHLWTILFPTVI